MFLYFCCMVISHKQHCSNMRQVWTLTFIQTQFQKKLGFAMICKSHKPILYSEENTENKEGLLHCGKHGPVPTLYKFSMFCHQIQNEPIFFLKWYTNYVKCLMSVNKTVSWDLWIIVLFYLQFTVSQLFGKWGGKNCGYITTTVVSLHTHSPSWPCPSLYDEAQMASTVTRS